MTILATEKYTQSDYLNQNLYKNDQKPAYSLANYRTMSAFIAVSQVDFNRF